MGFWVSLLGVLILTLHYYIPAVEDNIQTTFSFSFKSYMESVEIVIVMQELQNPLINELTSIDSLPEWSFCRHVI